MGIDLETTKSVTIEEVTINLMINRALTDKTIREIITSKTIEGITEVDKIIEEMTPNRGIGIGVRIEKDKAITVVTILEVEIEVDMDIYNRARTLSDDRDRSGSRSRSNSRVSTNRDQLRCYRCGEYDHFAQECPKTPTDDEMGHSDTEQASLQMLTHYSLPFNANGEVECLNL